MKYKRIMIFGLPGAGKSTYAVQLFHQLKLPLYHLDKYFYVENWRERPREDFLRIEREIVLQDQWIIDGNALHSLEIRYSRAELVLYFLAPRPLCLARLIKRRLFKDCLIQDRSEGCPERLRYSLIRYMWTFDRRVRPLLAHLHKVYPAVSFYKVLRVCDQKLKFYRA